MTLLSPCRDKLTCVGHEAHHTNHKYFSSVYLWLIFGIPNLPQTGSARILKAMKYPLCQWRETDIVSRPKKERNKDKTRKKKKEKTLHYTTFIWTGWRSDGPSNHSQNIPKNGVRHVFTSLHSSASQNDRRLISISCSFSHGKKTVKPVPFTGKKERTQSMPGKICLSPLRCRWHDVGTVKMEEARCSSESGTSTRKRKKSGPYLSYLSLCHEESHTMSMVPKVSKWRANLSEVNVPKP